MIRGTLSKLFIQFGSNDRFSPVFIRRNLDFGGRTQRAPSWYYRRKRTLIPELIHKTSFASSRRERFITVSLRGPFRALTPIWVFLTKTLLLL
jgi:hypothetical protein